MTVYGYWPVGMRPTARTCAVPSAAAPLSRLLSPVSTGPWQAVLARESEGRALLTTADYKASALCRLPFLPCITLSSHSSASVNHLAASLVSSSIIMR